MFARLISIKDIYAAHGILVASGFPPEITAIILDFLSASTTYIKDVPLLLSIHDPTGISSSPHFFNRLPIGRDEGIDQQPIVRPRKVIFQFVSKDWNITLYPRGLYDDASSYFDTSIFRAEDPGAGGISQEPKHALYPRAISAAPAAKIKCGQMTQGAGDMFVNTTAIAVDIHPRLGFARRARGSCGSSWCVMERNRRGCPDEPTRIAWLL
jgi:hypothetical protein